MFTLTPQNTKLSQMFAVSFKGKAGIGKREDYLTNSIEFWGGAHTTSSGVHFLRTLKNEEWDKDVSGEG